MDCRAPRRSGVQASILTRCVHRGSKEVVIPARPQRQILPIPKHGTMSQSHRPYMAATRIANIRGIALNDKTPARQSDETVLVTMKVEDGEVA